MQEQTLSIIKPDGVARNAIGQVVAILEKAGLRVVAMKMVHLSPEEGGRFYAVHQARPFYNDLKAFISSGPIVAMVLEGEGAIAKNREVMGATNPRDAKPGTIRRLLAESIERNTVHGSDSPESAAVEIPFFFDGLSILPRG
jgi:nucleoside-diphosphate kinase